MSAIDRYARLQRGHEVRVAQSVALLKDAALAHAGTIVQASSLGAEDMVITDLIARHQLPIDIATLQTGRLHAQTLALVPRIEQHYGLRVVLFEPDERVVITFVREQGESPMFKSIALRKACCDLRKLQPLARLLQHRTAWVTGLRREQSDTRADVPWADVDAQQRIKFNPLAHWTWADVWQHIQTHNVPYNPLHDDFFPSIGCEPCTRAITDGEPFRAGRWWWEDETAKECGLHVDASPPKQPTAQETIA